MIGRLKWTYRKSLRHDIRCDGDDLGKDFGRLNHLLTLFRDGCGYGNGGVKRRGRDNGGRASLGLRKHRGWQLVRR